MDLSLSGPCNANNGHNTPIFITFKSNAAAIAKGKTFYLFHFCAILLQGSTRICWIASSRKSAKHAKQRDKMFFNIVIVCCEIIRYFRTLDLCYIVIYCWKRWKKNLLFVCLANVLLYRWKGTIQNDAFFSIVRCFGVYHSRAFKRSWYFYISTTMAGKYPIRHENWMR